MKINKKETYSIEELTKEELLFLFQVIEKIQLSPESSPLSFQLAAKFKEFRAELLDESLLTCEGCETTIGVEEVVDPFGIKTSLCPTCLLQREHLFKRISLDESRNS